MSVNSISAQIQEISEYFDQILKQIESFERNMSSESMDRLLTTPSPLCALCSSSSGDCPLDPALKPSIGVFTAVPNEVLALILRNLSFAELSRLSISNKWFRDFIVEYFIKSKTGFQLLFNEHYFASSAHSKNQKDCRLHTFARFGVLVKRLTCLYPTAERMEILVKIFNQLDGIPSPTLMAFENHNMRFIFQCYGQLIHKLIAGWDDQEVVYVFKVLQHITHMEQHIKTVVNSPLGARQTIEFYIRSFYRSICLDPIETEDKMRSITDTMFWVKRILKPHPLPIRARLLVIIFGPLISHSPTPTAIPYIGWWDLTDTFFINNGLQELGNILHMIAIHRAQKSPEDRLAIELLETIIKLPENWLFENVASLLFYAGDDITYAYFMSKLEAGSYGEVAQRLVYLTLVTHKLTKETKSVFDLIERLATSDNKVLLINELPIAFSEAIVDIDGAIELEDERDVTELHEINSAYSDLMGHCLRKLFSIKTISSESIED